MTTAEIVATYHAKGHGPHWQAFCPVHESRDRNGHRPSLSISAGSDGRTLLKCFAGCATEDILAAKALTFADIGPTTTNGSKHIADTYPYDDEHGHLLYEVVRWEPKDFSVRRPNGADWIWNLHDTRRVLYRLRGLKDATEILIPEGEKDVDALISRGFTATTYPGGAGKWRSDYTDQLKTLAPRARIILIPDNDQPGRESVARIKTQLAGLPVFVLDVPEPAKDLSAWFARGHTADELRARIDATITPQLEAEALSDGVLVVQEGQRIAAEGIPWCVHGLMPAYGMLGFLVAYAKVGKTTLSYALGNAIAMGQPFLERETQPSRVLIIAAEDPPEYTAWVARHMQVDPDRVTFYRRPLTLNGDGLQRIIGTVKTGHYGVVLMASWQALIRGLVKDENDNAGAVQVTEAVKVAARETGIPWFIDAHSGKGEDQSDDADPTHALRGASAAAGAADYMWSLRYADGPFKSTRKLSGKGRFVNFEPLVLQWHDGDGSYSLIASNDSMLRETTRRLLLETGALAEEPHTLVELADLSGLRTDPTRKMTGGQFRQLRTALKDWECVGSQTVMRHGRKRQAFMRLEPGMGEAHAPDA